MFEAFIRLRHWLAANGIDKPVAVNIVTDTMTADHIGRVLRDEANALVFGQPRSEPVREGQIYGIHFRIVVDAPP